MKYDKKLEGGFFTEKVKYITKVYFHGIFKGD